MPKNTDTIPCIMKESKNQIKCRRHTIEELVTSEVSVVMKFRVMLLILLDPTSCLRTQRNVLVVCPHVKIQSHLNGEIVIIRTVNA